MDSQVNFFMVWCQGQVVVEFFRSEDTRGKYLFTQTFQLIDNFWKIWVVDQVHSSSFQPNRSFHRSVSKNHSKCGYCQSIRYRKNDNWIFEQNSKAVELCLLRMCWCKDSWQNFNGKSITHNFPIHSVPALPAGTSQIHADSWKWFQAWQTFIIRDSLLFFDEHLLLLRVKQQNIFQWL